MNINFNGLTDENMINAIIEMCNRMVDSYNKQCNNTQMQERFANSFEIKVGKKYIRLIANNSYEAYIVNSYDDTKFTYGDLLYPNGKTPARNKARGNIFGEYHVTWLGLDYLR